MYSVKVQDTFCGAHFLRNYKGKCEKLHGHNWSVKAILGTDELDEVGIAYDFKLLKKDLNEIVDLYDHEFLNEIPPFDKQLNPTSENLAKYIFEQLAKKLPDHIRVISIEVGESDKYKAIYEE